MIANGGMDNIERINIIKQNVAKVLSNAEWSSLNQQQKNDLVGLVSKRIARAKRPDENLIMADLMLLRQKSPQFFNPE